MTEEEIEAAVDRKQKAAYLRFVKWARQKSLYDEDHRRRLREAEKVANS